MNEIAYQWGRFVWWVYNANPEAVATILAAVVSACVTAVLALLTFYNVRAAYRQARAMLQPALRLEATFHNDPQQPPKYDSSGVAPATSESGIGSLELLNLGTNPVVLLDVTGIAQPFGMPDAVKHFGFYDEQILYPGVDYRRVVSFDFSKEVSEHVRRKVGCGFEFQVVASDLSRQISLTYKFHPVVGRTTNHLGVPWRVWLKYRTLGVRGRYYYLKHGAMMKLSRLRKKSD